MKTPTVVRPPSGPVSVFLPYRKDVSNRDILNDAGPGTRPLWDKDAKLWSVSRSKYLDVVDVLRHHFPSVVVVQQGNATFKCDTRCREARGWDCQCSCAGSDHGTAFIHPNERVVGETTIISKGGTTNWTRTLLSYECANCYRYFPLEEGNLWYDSDGDANGRRTERFDCNTCSDRA